MEDKKQYIKDFQKTTAKPLKSLNSLALECLIALGEGMASENIILENGSEDNVGK
ncbi:MAG: hypothetical protein IIX45_10560 [Lachnospiraceae bacterium]|nr:hypothetical protein [Lachnospiraceae bacterium]